ncbi:MAG: N-acetylmuramoyl-L-alanine amidase [Anaerolineae bacterium]|nr:N-acetylmuramoyl-L-alanine amidase [Anaerolineae bacterium]
MNDSFNPIPSGEEKSAEKITDNKQPASKNKTTKTALQPARFALFSAIQTIISISIVTATLFTLFTPRNLMSGQMFDSIILALQSTPDVNKDLTPTAPSALPLIGIVAGHDGHDSGAVCQDGLTEASVNMKIATLVRQNLMKDGYNVELLQEFDPRLDGFQALALIS